MSFEDIKGQSKTIEILKSYLKTSSLAGAYLFIGQEAIGKYSVAKNLAKAINCLKKKDDSCDICASCLKIDKRQHPDIHFIEPLDSDTIKIEYIRQLKKDIVLRPYEGAKKLFIINDAHRLTAEAANALLKILEEPPRDSLIILISSRPTLLFKTIISRCKILRFYPLVRTELKEILEKDYSLDNNLAHFLAYFCEGRIGSALRLKGTDILKDKNRIIDEFTMPNAAIPKSYNSRPRMPQYRQNISNNGTTLRLNNLPMQDREDVRIYLNILASWFRDIYLIKTGMPHKELINLDRKDELLRFMSRYTWLDLDESLNLISDSLLSLEQNINVKLLLSNLKWFLKG